MDTSTIIAVIQLIRLGIAVLRIFRFDHLHWSPHCAILEILNLFINFVFCHCVTTPPHICANNSKGPHEIEE